MKWKQNYNYEYLFLQQLEIHFCGISVSADIEEFQEEIGSFLFWNLHIFKCKKHLIHTFAIDSCCQFYGSIYGKNEEYLIFYTLTCIQAILGNHKYTKNPTGRLLVWFLSILGMVFIFLPILSITRTRIIERFNTCRWWLILSHSTYQLLVLTINQCKNNLLYIQNSGNPTLGMVSPNYFSLQKG